MDKITVTNRNIETLIVSQALVRLTSSRDLSPKTQFNLMKFLKKFDPVAKAYMEVKTKILEEHCMKDRNDKVSPDEKGNFRFLEPERKLADEKLAELLEQSTKVECRKIEIKVDNLLTKADVMCPHCEKIMPTSVSILTAAEMAQLECVVDFKE